MYIIPNPVLHIDSIYTTNLSKQRFINQAWICRFSVLRVLSVDGTASHPCDAGWSDPYVHTRLHLAHVHTWKGTFSFCIC